MANDMRTVFVGEEEVSMPVNMSQAEVVAYASNLNPEFSNATIRIGDAGVGTSEAWHLDRVSGSKG